MKFILVVLALKFIVDLLTSKKDKAMLNDAMDKRIANILHPAEFGLR